MITQSPGIPYDSSRGQTSFSLKQKNNNNERNKKGKEGRKEGDLKPRNSPDRNKKII